MRPVAAPVTQASGPEQLPPAIRGLGWTSFLTDLSSEAIYPLLPGFVRGLGGSSIEIGLIDGVAKKTAEQFFTAFNKRASGGTAA